MPLSDVVRCDANQLVPLDHSSAVLEPTHFQVSAYGCLKARCSSVCLPYSLHFALSAASLYSLYIDWGGLSPCRRCALENRLQGHFSSAFPWAESLSAVLLVGAQVLGGWSRLASTLWVKLISCAGPLCLKPWKLSKIYDLWLGIGLSFWRKGFSYLGKWWMSVWSLSRSSVCFIQLLCSKGRC